MSKKIVFVSLVVLLPLLVFGQSGKGMSDQRQVIVKKEMRCAKSDIAEQLKLDDKQREQIEALQLKLRRDLIPLKAQLQLARLDLQDALKKLDQKAIDAAVGKINEAKAQLFKLHVGQQVEFLKLLSEDQRKLLREKCHPPRIMRRMQMKAPGMGLGADEPQPAFGWIGEDSDPLILDLPLEEIELDIDTDE